MDLNAIGRGKKSDSDPAPSQEKRFNVTIKAEVVTTDGQPFADTVINYHDMSYPSLVEVEQVWKKLHDELVALGPKKLGHQK